MNGNPPLTYEWFNPSGIDLGFSDDALEVTLDLSNPLTPPGTYTFKVTDSDDCEDRDYNGNDNNNESAVLVNSTS